MIKSFTKKQQNYYILRIIHLTFNLIFFMLECQ